MKHHKSQKKMERFHDVEALEELIATSSPPSGEYLYDYKLEEAKTINQDDKEFHKKFKVNFSDLPISQQTIHGLNQRKFVKMTQIQRCVIPHALAGRDILAASKTGSGKTLSYLVPLVEILYRNKFIPMDGLGAIVLVPVRQLAMQVFEVLNSFTKNIEISVGLLIGGKGLEYEKQKIHNMNILVCTPGRLLQHLQQTYGFETHNLKLLVLDEADLMLQLGFKQSLNDILKQLPQRQTMLFSATLKQSMHSLAMLSLKTPQRIFLHDKQAAGAGDVGNMYETPLKLSQYYMLVEHELKINTLYSFLKEHQKQKTLVFLSTCKQVRFVYEAMKTFKLGCPIYQLQGRQQQKKRMAIFYTFCEKQFGVLFCTNIASRGLDFPQVDWVIQADVPQDIETYVHRVGRTARFRREGRALMFVDPSESKFINNLKQKKIQINKISQNPQKLYSITNSLQTRCIQNPDLKYLAQRALISYMKFIFKAPNKEVFDVHKMNGQKFAQSLGLNNAPLISFKKKEQTQQNEQNSGKKMSKVEKLRQKIRIKKQQKKKKIQQNEEQEQQQEQQNKKKHPQKQQQEEFFKVKRTIVGDGSIKKLPPVTKNQLKKIKQQGHFGGKNKIIFDKDGNPLTYEQHIKQQYAKNIDKQVDTIDRISRRIRDHKQQDEEREKQRVKGLRVKERMKRRKLNPREQQQQMQAVIGQSDEQNSDDEDEDDD